MTISWHVQNFLILCVYCLSRPTKKCHLLLIYYVEIMNILWSLLLCLFDLMHIGFHFHSICYVAEYHIVISSFWMDTIMLMFLKMLLMIIMIIIHISPKRNSVELQFFCRNKSNCFVNQANYLHHSCFC